MNGLQLESNLVAIANALGLNNWQLIQAKYNGCSFYSLQSLSGSIMQSDIAKSISNGIYATNKIFGGSSTDANASSKLFMTTMALLNVNDNLNRKLVRKKLPYANQDNIEDMGLSGWSFSVNAIFIGTEYLQALNNFLAAVASPDPTVANQLVHPIYGLITGNTYLANIRLRYSSEARMAVALELTFEAEQGIAWIPAPLSAIQIGSMALLGVLSAISAVGNAVTITQAIAK